MSDEQKESEVDAYSYWYVFYPANIFLLGLSVVLLQLSYSDHRPSGGLSSLLVNPVVDWALILIFGLGIFVRLVSDFWRFKIFRYALGVALVSGAFLLAYFVIASLPLNVVIIFASIIIAIAVSR
jgi:hypothetical protein